MSLTKLVTISLSLSIGVGVAAAAKHKGVLGLAGSSEFTLNAECQPGCRLSVSWKKY